MIKGGDFVKILVGCQILDSPDTLLPRLPKYNDLMFMGGVRVSDSPFFQTLWNQLNNAFFVLFAGDEKMPSEVHDAPKAISG